MAVPEKGWRRIIVEKRTYSWRAKGTDWGIDVVVVTGAAFKSGKTAQQLRFTLEYDSIRVRLPGGQVARRQVAVAPGVVRLAIEQSLLSSPPFTGEQDASDIVLPRTVVRDLQASARKLYLEE